MNPVLRNYHKMAYGRFQKTLLCPSLRSWLLIKRPQRQSEKNNSISIGSQYFVKCPRYSNYGCVWKLGRQSRISFGKWTRGFIFWDTCWDTLIFHQRMVAKILLHDRDNIYQSYINRILTASEPYRNHIPSVY